VGSRVHRDNFVYHFGIPPSNLMLVENEAAVVVVAAADADAAGSEEEGDGADARYEDYDDAVSIGNRIANVEVPVVGAGP